MTPASIARFKAIYATVYGVELTGEEAEHRARQTLELYKAAYPVDNIPGISEEEIRPTMHLDD